MATMRPFSSHTLEGNWQEDRAKGPPLRGLIPDFGFREYRTTAKESFIAPSERPEASRLGQKKLRCGMVTPETLSEAAYSYGEGLPPLLKYDATSSAAAGAASLPSEAAPFPSTTTARETMAAATMYSEAAARRAAHDSSSLFHSSLAPAAGGAGSLRVDRGKKSLRKPGEPLVLGEHSFDYPSREVHKAVPEVSHDLAYMSLQVPSASGVQESVQLAGPGAPHGRFAAFAAAPRVVTDVTATQKEISMRAGRRVFADE